MPLKSFLTLAALGGLMALFSLRRRPRSSLRGTRLADRPEHALSQAAIEAADHEPANSLSPAAGDFGAWPVGKADGWLPLVQQGLRPAPSVGAA